MIPVYRKVSAASDDADTSNEKNIFRAYIKSGELYSTIAAAVINNINITAAFAEMKIRDKMNHTVAQIKSDARLCLWASTAELKTMAAKAKLLDFKDEFRAESEPWKDQVAALVKSIEKYTEQT
ncbi:hypothetical protein VHEMI05849 [[Torrubiella] hemipterigena]|uniref:Uncharacterized protein n=1 Tax=[Torrubiella] hemipterigena TaxID=1531966 RepID=A0A0A1T5F2_9HYPO|nr:hypothetical protein VHEMI05849 [[Torrubiella] hemipterigena]